MLLEMMLLLRTKLSKIIIIFYSFSGYIKIALTQSMIYNITEQKKGKMKEKILAPAILKEDPRVESKF